MVWLSFCGENLKQSFGLLLKSFPKPSAKKELVQKKLHMTLKNCSESRL
jgi:hypothetical protein